jgi:hypothetical protein
VDQRRFAGAASTPQQHVVGRVAGDELLSVGIDTRLLAIDVEQVVEFDRVEVGVRDQFAAQRGDPPHRSVDPRPVRCRSAGQQGIDALEHAPAQLDQFGDGFGHPGNPAR